jgi:hypothetical protein
MVMLILNTVQERLLVWLTLYASIKNPKLGSSMAAGVAPAHCQVSDIGCQRANVYAVWIKRHRQFCGD